MTHLNGDLEIVDSNLQNLGLDKHHNKLGGAAISQTGKKFISWDYSQAKIWHLNSLFELRKNENLLQDICKTKLMGNSRLLSKNDIQILDQFAPYEVGYDVCKRVVE